MTSSSDSPHRLRSAEGNPSLGCRLRALLAEAPHLTGMMLAIALFFVTGCSGGSSGSNPPVLPPSSPPPSVPTLGLVQDQTIAVGSVDRQFDYYAPPAIGASPPVVIVYHGGTENSDTTREPNNVFREWLNIADIDNVLVVYPNGSNSSGNPAARTAWWNDCRSSDEGTEYLDDVAFTDSLIDWAHETFDADLSRIYVTGPSNGGLMSYRLALELGDRIAGFAAYIANIPAESECAPLNIPIPAFILVGTADEFVPFDGGPIRGVFGNDDPTEVLSAHETRDFWINYNGASAPLDETSFPDIDDSDGSTVRRERFTGVADVSYYEVDGGGHVPPSIAHQISGSAETVVGRQNHDIESAEQAWAFLRDKRRN